MVEREDDNVSVVMLTENYGGCGAGRSLLTDLSVCGKEERKNWTYKLMIRGGTNIWGEPHSGSIQSPPTTYSFQ
jgi:hypothetical protein